MSKMLYRKITLNEDYEEDISYNLLEQENRIFKVSKSDNLLIEDTEDDDTEFWEECYQEAKKSGKI